MYCNQNKPAFYISLMQCSATMSGTKMLQTAKKTYPLFDNGNQTCCGLCGPTHRKHLFKKTNEGFLTTAEAKAVWLLLWTAQQDTICKATQLVLMPASSETHAITKHVSPNMVTKAIYVTSPFLSKKN